MTAPLQLHGQTFGHVLVLSRIENSAAGKARWLCRCLLDNVTFESLGASLTSGRTLSCGCHKAKQASLRNATHRMSDTPEHHAWTRMKQRCYNPKIRSYRWYGGRIQVCERYRTSFESFYADLGPRPSARHTLERLNNDGHYSCGQCEDCQVHGWPANLTWADWHTQANNRRKRGEFHHTASCRIPDHRCRERYAH